MLPTRPVAPFAASADWKPKWNGEFRIGSDFARPA